MAWLNLAFWCEIIFRQRLANKDRPWRSWFPFLDEKGFNVEVGEFLAPKPERI